MHSTFTLEPIHINDIVVYLKNERTGSSTIRKCKFIGQVVGSTDKMVEIRQLSAADQFVTPEECNDRGVVKVPGDEIIHIILSQSTGLQQYTDFFDEVGVVYTVKKHKSGWISLNINQGHIYSKYGDSIRINFNEKGEFSEFEVW